jgi:hypothetical protein
MRRRWLIGAGVAAVLLALPAASLVYQGGGGGGYCGSCHEISRNVDSWSHSTHRDVNCSACHGSVATANVGFHLGNVRRLWLHARGEAPEQIRLKHPDVAVLVERCAKCHRQEFADWQSGPHGVKYQKLFTDREHNRKRLLQEDCLRCHAMHYDGAIEDLVGPIDTKGPWQILQAGMAEQGALPCLACHQVHTKGDRLVKKEPAEAPHQQPKMVASLALFDRREQRAVPVAALPLPAMLDGAMPVKMSLDQRQALCYQCHAPLADRQVNGGDDRTPIGVHEGLSCLACHQKHGQKTAASCGTCHPRLSNCGRDVEKMDTTFASKDSRHNIHFVKCADCHPKGVPQKVRRALAGRGL